MTSGLKGLKPTKLARIFALNEGIGTSSKTFVADVHVISYVCQIFTHNLLVVLS